MGPCWACRKTGKAPRDFPAEKMSQSGIGGTVEGGT